MAAQPTLAMAGPVVVPAAVVKLLPTVLTCLEETGVGVRYPAGPFTRVALEQMWSGC